MRASDANAPKKTTRRGWRMASIAAMRKVLSPISEKMMSEKAWKRPCKRPAVVEVSLLSVAGGVNGRGEVLDAMVPSRVNVNALELCAGVSEPGGSGEQGVGFFFE